MRALSLLLLLPAAALAAELGTTCGDLRSAYRQGRCCATDPTTPAALPMSEFRYDAPEGHALKTDSYMPFMPMKDGWMQTHNTYRFLTVREQVLTVLGEAKHGMWRIHDNGMVRMYRKGGARGLALTDDVNDPALLATITKDYAAFIPKPDTPDKDGWSGYRYAANGEADGRAGFIDVPIYHAAFGGKYDDHVPIDLPHWFCTMSGPEFKDAADAWKYASAQPNANKVGPLGKRAGLDIREHYTNVIRFDLFPDAKVWIQIGSNDTAKSIFNQSDIDDGSMGMDIRYRALDTTKTDVEIYIFERPFFNVPYLFVTVVMDNKENDHMRYVRPDGAYWEALVARNLTGGLKRSMTFDPDVPVLDSDGVTALGLKTMRYTPLYGMNHLARPFDASGGWCPQRGGDWGSYPKNPGGSGFQNQYEEATPVCDALVADIKMWANLDAPTWNDPMFQLQNAGVRRGAVRYLGEGNQYGTFTDPYLVGAGITNPHALHYTNASNPDPMPTQMIECTFVDGIGTASKYMDPATGAAVGGGGLTPAEAAEHQTRLATAERPFPPAR